MVTADTTPPPAGSSVPYPAADAASFASVLPSPSMKVSMKRTVAAIAAPRGHMRRAGHVVDDVIERYTHTHTQRERERERESE